MIIPKNIARWQIVSLIAALAAGAILWNLHTAPPPPVASSPKEPVALMENVQQTSKGVGGTLITASAQHVELKRDFRNIISFAGQYVIAVDGLTLQYDIPSLDHRTLFELCKSMNQHLKIYPQSWRKIASPAYADITVSFVHEGREVFHISANKAKARPEGGIHLTGLSNASDKRLSQMGNISTGIPFFASLIYSNLQQQRQAP